MTRPITFTDIRRHLALHTDTPEERLARLERAARNCAAAVALLERTEARSGLVAHLVGAEVAA
jgi:hypothetical protein